MPDYMSASLLYATHYLQVLYTQNKGYWDGGKEQAGSLRNFDIEFSNVLFARNKLPDLIARINKKQKLSGIDLALLDICNAFPDAGAYLISVKLNATERIRWLHDALQASQKLKNNITTQAHLGNLGLAYYQLGELSPATEYFSQAFQLAEQIGDKYHQGAWLGNLGNIYALMGDHERAIEYHERHLGLMREIKDARGEGHALANLGVSYAYLGNVSKAIENYKQFLDLAIKNGDRREESQALMNLGFAYFDVGDLDSASSSLKSALEITVELGDRSTQSLVMGGLADVAIDRKEYRNAIRTLNEAIDILQEAYDVESELRLIQSLGNAYSASEDYDNALKTFSRLYTLADATGAKAAMCSALVNQTSIYREKGDLARAMKIGEKGLDLAIEIHSLSNEAFVRWQVGLIYEASGELTKAIGEMETAVKIEARIESVEVEQHQIYFRNITQNIT